MRTGLADAGDAAEALVSRHLLRIARERELRETVDGVERGAQFAAQSREEARRGPANNLSFAVLLPQLGYLPVREGRRSPSRPRSAASHRPSSPRVTGGPIGRGYRRRSRLGVKAILQSLAMDGADDSAHAFDPRNPGLPDDRHGSWGRRRPSRSPRWRARSRPDRVSGPGARPHAHAACGLPARPSESVTPKGSSSLRQRRYRAIGRRPWGARKSFGLRRLGSRRRPFEERGVTCSLAAAASQRP